MAWNSRVTNNPTEYILFCIENVLIDIITFILIVIISVIGYKKLYRKLSLKSPVESFEVKNCLSR